MHGLLTAVLIHAGEQAPPLPASVPPPLSAKDLLPSSVELQGQVEPPRRPLLPPPLLLLLLLLQELTVAVYGQVTVELIHVVSLELHQHASVVVDQHAREVLISSVRRKG